MTRRRCGRRAVLVFRPLSGLFLEPPFDLGLGANGRRLVGDVVVDCRLVHGFVPFSLFVQDRGVDVTVRAMALGIVVHATSASSWAARLAAFSAGMRQERAWQT